MAVAAATLGTTRKEVGAPASSAAPAGTAVNAPAAKITAMAIATRCTGRIILFADLRPRSGVSMSFAPLVAVGSRNGLPLCATKAPFLLPSGA